MSQEIDEQGAAVVSGDASGGPNTSHTNQVAALARLLDTVPAAAGTGDYEAAVIDGNVLGKETRAARRRSFRYLRELYLFRPEVPLFGALRLLAREEAEALPLLAALSAMARDTVFRASAASIVSSEPGDEVSSAQLGAAVAAAYPGTYKDSTVAKIGRNVSSSWEQAGHLESVRPGRKLRRRVVPGPAAVAYALLIGHLRGIQGQALLREPWPRILDLSDPELLEIAAIASHRSLLEYRQAGDVLEFSFNGLLEAVAREQR